MHPAAKRVAPLCRGATSTSHPEDSTSHPEDIGPPGRKAMVPALYAPTAGALHGISIGPV